MPALQFSALADETRCDLIDLLRDGPRPVHELASAFAVSRPAISRHLKLLKQAGLIHEERRGRENVYALDRPALKALSAWLELYWGRPDRLGLTGEDFPAPPHLEHDR